MIIFLTFSVSLHVAQNDCDEDENERNTASKSHHNDDLSAPLCELKVTNMAEDIPNLNLWTKQNHLIIKILVNHSFKNKGVCS